MYHVSCLLTLRGLKVHNCCGYTTKFCYNADECFYVIFRYGPLVKHWTMRYEAKHSHLKKLAQNLGNFINIPWTLASRHQKWQCYHWLGAEPLGQVEPEIGPGT